MKEKVMVYKQWNGKQNRFTLRKTDRKFFTYRWFDTIGAAKRYAEELGVEVVERPDLIKKWSTPHLNHIRVQ